MLCRRFRGDEIEAVVVMADPDPFVRDDENDGDDDEMYCDAAAAAAAAAAA
jgi:hypothetical protein